MKPLGSKEQLAFQIYFGVHHLHLNGAILSTVLAIDNI